MAGRHVISRRLLVVHRHHRVGDRNGNFAVGRLCGAIARDRLSGQEFRGGQANTRNGADTIAPHVAGGIYLSWRGMVPYVAVARLERRACLIGTGRANVRQMALDFGAQEFIDLEYDALEDIGEVDLVFDVMGGDIANRSAGLIRAGGRLVTVTGPTEARPSGGRTIDFFVVPDHTQLTEVVQRARNGRLRTNIGSVVALSDAVGAFNRIEKIKGKTVIRVSP